MPVNGPPRESRGVIKVYAEASLYEWFLQVMTLVTVQHQHAMDNNAPICPWCRFERKGVTCPHGDSCALIKTKLRIASTSEYRAFETKNGIRDGHLAPIIEQLKSRKRWKKMLADIDKEVNKRDQPQLLL
jgi:hypothetical protein